MVVEVDGRPVGRLRKPTQQHPWREGAFEVDHDTILVGLTWHFPVMRTDVFVSGRSVRDGRPIEAVLAEAPASLSNYEVWVGGYFQSLGQGSRARPRRPWSILIAASAAVWIVVLVASPLPPALRLPVGALLLIGYVVLFLAFLRSVRAFGWRVHRELLARPSLGDGRVAIWLAAFAGYLLLGVGVVILLLAVAST